jgi:hypothetical protein
MSYAAQGDTPLLRDAQEYILSITLTFRQASHLYASNLHGHCPAADKYEAIWAAPSLLADDLASDVHLPRGAAHHRSLANIAALESRQKRSRGIDAAVDQGRNLAQAVFCLQESLRGNS